MENNIVLFGKAKKIVNKNELFILFVVVLIVFLDWMSIQFSQILSILIMYIISLLYFASTLNFEKGLSGGQSAIFKISGIASAVVVIGILFALLEWPNSMLMLSVGVLGLVGSLIGAGVLNLLETKYFPQNKSIRIGVLIILSLVFLFAGG